MGDFNIDLMKTDSYRPIHDYLESNYSHSMRPTIYKPTRITATTATCIDNILTNNDDIIGNSFVYLTFTVIIMIRNFNIKTKSVNLKDFVIQHHEKLLNAYFFWYISLTH